MSQRENHTTHPCLFNELNLIRPPRNSCRHYLALGSFCKRLSSEIRPLRQLRYQPRHGMHGSRNESSFLTTRRGCMCVPFQSLWFRGLSTMAPIYERLTHVHQILEEVRYTNIRYSCCKQCGNQSSCTVTQPECSQETLMHSSLSSQTATRQL